jgi:hypothetical protein
MKNIHVLLTDKPSRLCYDKDDNLLFAPNAGFSTADGKQHIYITNDEEIKEGDYYIAECGSIDRPIHKHLGKEPKGDYKKIILTTNQDLIIGGVQAIDDEFLEWFVKNPSCEEVKTRKIGNEWIYNADVPQEEDKQKKCIYCNGKGYIDNHTGSARIDCLNCDTAKEPKQETNKTYYLDELPNMNKDVLLKMWNAAVPKLEPKQETLEEVAELYLENVNTKVHKDLERDGWMKIGFIDGAKWQAERMYSEEEVIAIVQKSRETGLTAEYLILTEQFKKK